MPRLTTTKGACVRLWSIGVEHKRNLTLRHTYCRLHIHIKPPATVEDYFSHYSTFLSPHPNLIDHQPPTNYGIYKS